jgi:hypothetical protein
LSAQQAVAYVANAKLDRCVCYFEVGMTSLMEIGGL